MKFIEIMQVYTGSNGDATKALYARLQKDHDIIGFVAMNVFRACKASERAKLYRGPFKGTAYDKKEWSIGLLCEALEKHGAVLDIAWGWARDERAIGFEDVIYIDLPTGQVSFHNAGRKRGPDYAGKWDGAKGEAPGRICRWINQIMHPQKAKSAKVAQESIEER